MPTLLARNAAVLATMDAAGTEVRDGGLFARDGVRGPRRAHRNS